MIKKLSLENTEILRSQIDIPSVRHAVVELILNSIDAKAMSITVTVHKLSVSVSDDGNGFDPQDLKLLKRNWSSKASPDTFGHCGSTLASLSVLADLEIQTRRYWNGYHAIYNNEEFICKQISNARIGTTVTVNNLFKNFPVRQKIALKEKTSEIKRSIEIVALGFPEISLQFKDDHHLIQTKGSGNFMNTFDSLFGQNLGESRKEVNSQNSDIAVKGFISNDLFHSRYHQYLYVNQRYISKSVLHDHIDAGNQKGFHSIFLIHIHLPWDSISLFKNDCYSYELKLIKDDGILDFILKALGIAIDKNVSSSKTSQKKRKCTPSSSIRTSARVDFDSVFQKPFELSKWRNPVFENIHRPLQSLRSDPFTNSDQKHLNIQKSELKHFSLIGQMDAKFILCSFKTIDKTQIICLDQHAVDERIRLEELESLLNSEGTIKSYFLQKPLILEKRILSIMTIYKRDLERWGIIINDQGVIAYPNIFKSRLEKDFMKLKNIVMDHLQYLQEGFSNSQVPKGYKNLLNSMACRSAIKFGDQLTREECHDLIIKLGECSFPFQCAHGRPSMIPLVTLVNEHAGPFNEKITAFSRAATLIVSQESFNASLSSSWQDIWVLPAEGHDFMNALDQGASKVILPAPKDSSTHDEIIRIFPLDRIVWKLSDVNCSIEMLLNHGCQFMIDVESRDELENAISIFRGYSNFLISVNSLDFVDIPTLNSKGFGVVINQDLISLGKHGIGTMNLGDIICNLLTSDRPDGLFPTIVTDEQGLALGLCYSSKDSLNEAIRLGKGVYWSRKRGLWLKGETSGATQELLSIAIDCDRDTLRFAVRQKSPGFCHLETQTCFGSSIGVAKLMETLNSRKKDAPKGSYTRRLFDDENLLKAKIIEEAHELCDAESRDDIAWEAADLIYFALTKCVAAGVSLEDIGNQLDKRSKKVFRRSGDAKPEFLSKSVPKNPESRHQNIKMNHYALKNTSKEDLKLLLQRPIIKSDDIMTRVKPIMMQVREEGDKAIMDFTRKFDNIDLESCVLRPPYDPSLMKIDPNVRGAIDQAFANIRKFHQAQFDPQVLEVETLPGVLCSRFIRPIEKVGLYVPGGTAVLPSTALMLGIPAQVAGCKEIVMATPPTKNGKPAPEVMYVADKIGATCVLLAGGAQAVAGMAYGTKSIPKVDKIVGPGNQYVTAAKMIVQADSSVLVSIDMPAGPSELLVIADETCVPKYVAADLLSQAEHGEDSQVVLVAVNLSKSHLEEIEMELESQGSVLPRSDIVRVSISKSFILEVSSMKEAIDFSNSYAPEHLILHFDDADCCLDLIQNAGSVFVGRWSPESCGDYASGTNHTLPTYGYAKMYSGVNTNTFVKHLTSQKLTKEGLNLLGDTVTTLAHLEGLEAHRNAVAVRLNDIRK